MTETRSPPLLIEYDTPRAFSVIGDGRLRIVTNDGPAFCFALSEAQWALLIEDASRYVAKSIKEKKK